MNDTQALIGKVLPEDAERDAIHIAVLPVISDDDYIGPGHRVKLVPGTTDRVRRVVSYDDLGIGIADPFLMNSILKGERFFAFIQPNTVTGMRHHWALTAVDAPEKLTESERWLHDFADRWGINYDEMLRVAVKGNGEDNEGYDYILAVGRNLHSVQDLEGEDVLFWQHLETLTGRQYSLEHREGICWTCTC